MKLFAISLLILSFGAQAQRVKENLKQQEITAEAVVEEKIVKPVEAPKVVPPKKTVDRPRQR